MGERPVPDTIQSVPQQMYSERNWGEILLLMRYGHFLDQFDITATFPHVEIL